MKRKLLIAIVILATLAVAFVIAYSREEKVTVFFSPPHVETNGTSIKVTFNVTNTASRSVAFGVTAIERLRSSEWIADTNFHPNIWPGDVEAKSTAQFTYPLPFEPVPTRLRVRVYVDATPAERAQLAMRRLWSDFWGHTRYKQYWFPAIYVPTSDVLTPEFE